MKQQTFWNGEKTQARLVKVRVGSDKGIHSRPWWRGLEGTERTAVEVTYGANVFFMDDDDWLSPEGRQWHKGSAWDKVTTGKGSPRYGHRELPADSVVLTEVTRVEVPITRELDS